MKLVQLIINKANRKRTVKKGSRSKVGMIINK